MEKEKTSSVIKIILSFFLSIVYLVSGFLLTFEYPSISILIKILGIVGIIITFIFIAINFTSWAENINNKIKEYFLLWLEIAYTLLIIGAIALSIRFFVFQPFLVDGNSMEPNFSDGQYLIVNELSYNIGVKPKRGDIIVFKYPNNPSENFIKRIIALPGEKVKIQNHNIFIDEKILEEKYIPYKNQTDAGENQEWVLENNEYFVVGDNRLPGQSSDSRLWGPLDKKYIIGKVWVIVWPPRDIKSINHPQYNL